jgi:hypothetical protein
MLFCFCMVIVYSTINFMCLDMILYKWSFGWFSNLGSLSLSLSLSSAALLLDTFQKREPKFMMPHIVWYPLILLKVIKKQCIQV